MEAIQNNGSVCLWSRNVAKNERTQTETGVNEDDEIEAWSYGEKVRMER